MIVVGTKEELQEALDHKYERWEYLNEIAEAIEAYKANNQTRK